MELFPGVSRQFGFTYKGMKFSGVFPSPKIDRRIDVGVAQEFGGVALHSIPTDQYIYTRACVELDLVLDSIPEEMKTNSFLEVDDPDIVSEIYAEYYKKKKAWLTGLKKNKQPAPPTPTTPRDGSNAPTIPDEALQDTAERVR